MREFRCRHNRRVGDFDAVMQFIFFLQAAQNGDGRFHAWFVNHHFLEAALQGRILLDVLTVFIKRRRPDAMQLTARQRRLEHVARVHGAFCLASADHRMDFVDKNDDAPFILSDLFKHRLEAFFEFAAILRPRQQCRHIERQHLLALERFGHFVVDDALRQPLDNRRLADARLADQYRVIFGTPLENLDGAADFIITTNHWVELALTRPLGEVDRVFFQRFALTFGFLRIDALPATDRGNRRF